MTRLLIASDIHNNKKVVDKLLKIANENTVDLIILAGDIATYDSFNPDILKDLVKKYKVLFVPGNCDFDKDINKLNEMGINLDKKSYSFNGIHFIGIGSQNWKLNLNKEDFEELKSVFDKVKSKKTILISHLHVKNTIAEFSGIKGDNYLKKIIDKYQPLLVFCGHVHEAEGLKDKINKSQIIQVGKKGLIIDLV